MKITFYTGYIPMYGADYNKHHKETGILREQAVNIKRFLDLFEGDEDISLVVCTTEIFWKDLSEKYPFILNDSVKFLDYQTVLSKQGFEENPYWYDALRFQVFATIENSSGLACWIDEDALILRRDIVDLLKNNKEFIILPKDIYPWGKDGRKELKKYESVFSQFGLSTNPEDELYVNTGTLLGGPTKYLQLLSQKILEVEKSLGLRVQPSAVVLEYVSCYCIQEFCTNLKIPFERVDGDNYVWHYTCCRLPRTSYLQGLWERYPEDKYLFLDFYNLKTFKFRVNCILKIFDEILSNRTTDKSEAWLTDLICDEWPKQKFNRGRLI